MDKTLITFFDSLYPCWNEEMLLMEGIDMEAVRRLVDAGFLICQDDIYFLSEAGALEFKTVANDHYIDAKPGIGLPSITQATKTGLFLKLLDRAHAQRWGIKEYYRSPKLPLYPVVQSNSDYEIREDKVIWKYEEGALEAELKEKFPIRSMSGRHKKMEQDSIRAQMWANDKNNFVGTFEPDVLYVCRYDYIYYAEFKGHPSDPMKLINTDRYSFVHSAGDENRELSIISKFRRWVNYQRRVLTPGFWDIDTQEQDSICQLIFVFEEEEKAERAALRLSRFGNSLAEGVAPLEIWTVSIETMRGTKNKEEIIWELLPQKAHPVYRSIAGAG